MMNSKTDKLVRRTTMVATVTASYFLLTADYGSEPNALDPIKKAILSAQNFVKEYVLGPNKESQDSQLGKLGSRGTKEHP
ncbi:hypothetical protein I3760_01G055200 [Carya illinoinensis]|nr:hypothetical protein I3760_01G055200 [Carya illinoinensis]